MLNYLQVIKNKKIAFILLNVIESDDLWKNSIMKV